MSPIEFLRARLAEDEAAAKACDMWPAPWSVQPNGSGQTVWSSKSGVSSVASCEWSKPARHIVRWDPARVLAEVAAKRAVLRELDAGYDGGYVDALWDVIVMLIQPYSGHPDFDPTWQQASSVPPQ